jgi:hypothetical protein
MKVTNWVKNVPAALVAAGIWVGPAYAVDYPLGDASFDDTDVNASTYTDYAYTVSGHVTSWEDIGNTGPDPNAFGFANWWYNTGYSGGASGPPPSSPQRPDPRTGDQALHGGGDYAWQTVPGGVTFETGKSYTFSAYLGGDSDASGSPSDGGDRAWLYIFNANETPDLSTVYFDGDSLVGAFFNRDGSSTLDTGAGTRTNQGWTNGGGSEWGAASVTYTATALDDGQPIGVGMYGRGDNAFDDMAFCEGVDCFAAPDPLRLNLEIDTTTGAVKIVNDETTAVYIDYYEIISPGDSLDSVLWSSLQDQDLAGFPAGDGTGNGWEEAGGIGAGVLAESYLTGHSKLDGLAEISLGNLYTPADPNDLVFSYGQIGGSVISPTADFDGNGVVDGTDLVLWEISYGLNDNADANGDGFSDGKDFLLWQQQLGDEEGPTGTSSLIVGDIIYVTPLSASSAVPEPSSVLLVGMGLTVLLAGRRKK